MKPYLRLLFAALAALLMVVIAVASGRKDAPKKEDASPEEMTDTRQGISGRVEIWEGNFMPMIEPAQRSGQITPGAGRRVRAHEPVVVSGGLAPSKRDSVATPLIVEAVCDSLGEFFLPAPPGKYSVFVEDDGGWYFNGFDGEGVQGACAVDSGKVSEILIKITTKATF